MIAPNLGGQQAPFSAVNTTVSVALYPEFVDPEAEVPEAHPLAGRPMPLAVMEEFGQWCAWRASESHERGEVLYDNAVYDPMWKAWMCRPEALDLDNVITRAWDHRTGEWLENPEIVNGVFMPVAADGTRTATPFYGWEVLARGQATFENGGEDLSASAGGTSDAGYDDGSEETAPEDFGSVVSDLFVGCWTATASTDDAGFVGIRQQAPAPVFAIQSDSTCPLPQDPSFEWSVRLDNLQVDGSGACPEPWNAFVALEFGGGRWRVRIGPHVNPAITTEEAAAKAERVRKTQWQATLEERTGTDEWTVRAGGQRTDAKGKQENTGLALLSPNTDGTLSLLVQCLDGRIGIRSSHGATLDESTMESEGAIYSATSADGSHKAIHVDAGPATIYGSYCTFRTTFRMVQYAATGWVLFPPVTRAYDSAGGNIRATVTGTGLVRKELPADTAPWTFSDFVSEKVSSEGWPWPRLPGAWGLFDGQDTFRMIVARGAQNLGTGELCITDTEALEVTNPQWWDDVSANQSATFVVLRLQSATNYASRWFGEATISQEDRIPLGSASVTVRTVKVEWPVVLTPNEMNWVPLSRQDWITWSVQTRWNGDEVATAEGSLVRADNALPGQLGPLSTWHGRAWWKIAAEWENETGTAWCGGDRWLMLSKGPARSKDQAELPLVDLTQLLRDVEGCGVPPQDFERFSDVVEECLLRAGIPSTAFTVQASSSGPFAGRVQAQTPKDDAQFEFRDKGDMLSVVRELAQVEGRVLWCSGDHVYYADVLADPTVAQAAREFAYCDGRGGTLQLPQSWPITEQNHREPSEDDREVSELVVVAETEAGPVEVRAWLVTPDRAANMDVVGGVGRPKRVTLGGADVRTKNQANYLARTKIELLASDVGDFATEGPADPELQLFDPGKLYLSRHDLADGIGVECVAVHERYEVDGSYRMTCQFRSARGGRWGVGT